MMKNPRQALPSALRALDARRRRRLNKKRSVLSTGRRILFCVGVSAAVLFMGAVLAAAAWYVAVARSLPPVDELAVLMHPAMLTTPTRFYDRSGQTVLYTRETPGLERRYLYVDPSAPLHFSPQLVQTVTALERNYWSGLGISLADINDPQPHTIAERLIDDLLLSAEPDDPQKGIRMRVLAVQAQIRFGKAQILEWYLNSAWFGRLAYGADQAAQLYLGKSAAELDLAESILLAGLPGAPLMNPLDAPQSANERFLETLALLTETGQYSFTDLENVKNAHLVINDVWQTQDRQDEFLRYALGQAKELLPGNQLQRGGVKVITTLDADLQEQLACTLETQLERLEAGNGAQTTDCSAAALLPDLLGVAPSDEYTDDLSASGLVLDPRTAQVLAWSNVSPTGQSDSAPGYLAGNLLAPFVATAAFTHGMSPATLVWDAPHSEDEDTLNPDGRWHGPQSLRTVIENGYLDAIVRVAEQTGFDNVWRLASTLGLTSLRAEDFAQDLAQGGGLTSLTEIGQAYSVFAALGRQSGVPSGSGALEPQAVVRIEDIRGAVLAQPADLRTGILLEESLAWLTTDLLGGVTRTPEFDIGRPATAVLRSAGGGSQVWAAGYTPQRVTVVWMGLPAAQNSQNQTNFPAVYAGGVWKAVTEYASRDEPVESWQQPDNLVQVTVCRPSGMLPTADCLEQADEWFLVGSEPTAYDTLYQSFAVNVESGRLATVFTPSELMETRTWLIVPDAYQDWAQLEGMDQPPELYDAIPPQEAVDGAQISTPASLGYVSGQVQIEGSADIEDFAGYQLDAGQGVNPQNWFSITAETNRPVGSGSLGLWDTAGLNGLYTLRLTVWRADNRAVTVYRQLVVDNTLPSAAVSWPAPDQLIAYDANKQVVFLADAADALGIERVIWYIDGAAVDEREQAPWLLSWPPVRGSHTVRVEARDLAGNSAFSPELTFTVR